MSANALKMEITGNFVIKLLIQISVRNELTLDVKNKDSES